MFVLAAAKLRRRALSTFLLIIAGLLRFSSGANDTQTTSPVGDRTTTQVPVAGGDSITTQATVNDENSTTAQKTESGDSTTKSQSTKTD